MKDRREGKEKKKSSVVGAEGGEFLINQAAWPAFVLRYSTQDIFSSFFGPWRQLCRGCGLAVFDSAGKAAVWITNVSFLSLWPAGVSNSSNHQVAGLSLPLNSSLVLDRADAAHHRYRPDASLLNLICLFKPSNKRLSLVALDPHVK